MRVIRRLKKKCAKITNTQQTDIATESAQLANSVKIYLNLLVRDIITTSQGQRKTFKKKNKKNITFKFARKNTLF